MESSSAASSPLLKPRPRWLVALGGGEVNLGDLAFRWLTALFAAGAILMLAAMSLQLLRASSLSLSRFGPGFVVSQAWDPVRQLFGALPFIFGTVVSSLLALAIAVPVALGVAILLSELAPPAIRGPLGFMVELLA